MYPKLVENKIKNIMNVNLKYCHDLKMKYYNFIFNMICFASITLTIFTILYFKYKKKQDPEIARKKEDMKRNYILYNLRKFQNINNKEIGTINSY